MDEKPKVLMNKFLESQASFAEKVGSKLKEMNVMSKFTSNTLSMREPKKLEQLRSTGQIFTAKKLDGLNDVKSLLHMTANNSKRNGAKAAEGAVKQKNVSDIFKQAHSAIVKKKNSNGKFPQPIEIPGKERGTEAEIQTPSAQLVNCSEVIIQNKRTVKKFEEFDRKKKSQISSSIPLVWEDRFLREISLLSQVQRVPVDALRQGNPFFSILRRKLLHNHQIKALSEEIEGYDGNFSEFRTRKHMYRFESELLSDEFSKFCRFRQVLSDQPVLVRVVSREAMQSAANLEAVRVEINSLKFFSAQPWIIQLYETFSDDSHVFIVYENLPGKDLDSYLQEYSPMARNDLGRFGSKLAQAIKYIHSKGVVHRNVSPQTVWVDAHMEPKLVRFEHSSQTDLFENSTVSQPKFPYSAPEFLLDKRRVTKKSDLWGLGVVLYKLGYGKDPFSKADAEKVIRGEPIALVFPEEPDSCPELGDLLSKLLKVSPEERPSINEILSHPFFERSELETSVFSLSESKELARREAVFHFFLEVGFTEEFIMSSIQNHLFNHCSAAYYSLIAS